MPNPDELLMLPPRVTALWRVRCYADARYFAAYTGEPSAEVAALASDLETQGMLPCLEDLRAAPGQLGGWCDGCRLGTTEMLSTADSSKKEKQAVMHAKHQQHPAICSGALAFETIQALTDDALNTAIDQHCTTHHWYPDPRNGYHYYVLEHPDIGIGRMWSTVPHLHYTASWDRLMPLVLHCGLCLSRVGERWVISDRTVSYALEAQTEAEVRRRLAELVLWQARQEDEHAKP